MKTEFMKLNPIRIVRGIKVFNIKNIKNFPKIYSEIIRISNIAFNIKDARDEYDDHYSYLVAYDECNNEIVSYYRYILIDKDNLNNLSNAKYYNFHPHFINEVLSRSIGLGRSVVNKEAEAEVKDPGGGIFAIWKGGLGPLVYKYQIIEGEKQYLFGQASLQNQYYEKNITTFDGKNMIIAMVIKNYGDNPSNMVAPKYDNCIPGRLFSFYLPKFKGDYKEDERTLKAFLKENNIHIPSLLFHYCRLDPENSGSLRFFLPVYNALLNCTEMALCFDLSQLPETYKRIFIGDPSDINLDAFD